ncbi:uncharacterized protein LOC118191021 [Stegodyphus dumicola]|uniref:uncharacterized protein LOC118191021 n=1 Tax=Stegodyphus dumicola TaxID=202533 RepID=UPI0015ABC9EA|nr:uncharacterized protein LOC118191021 [Stegodyphus dumicola]
MTRCFQWMTDLEIVQGWAAIENTDDIIVLMKEDSLGKLEMLFQEITPYFEKWQTEEGLQYCLEKTNAMFFPRGGRKCRSSQLRFNGTRIKFVDSMKYLGVTIDNKLTFAEHFKEINRRTNDILLFYKRSFTAHTLSFKSKIICEIYKNVAIPIIMYGIGCWGPRAGELCRIRMKLDTIQRSWCLAMTRCFRTVSTEVLCVLAGTPPLSLLYKTYYDKCLLRAGKLDFKLYGDNLITRYAYEKFNRLLIHPAYNIACSFDRDIPNISMYDIYTDGSGLDGRIGAAFVVYFYGIEILYEQYRLNSYNSVFQAESCALEKDLQYISFKIPRPSIVNVYSDCQSLLQILCCPVSTNFTVYNIKQLYGEISDQIDIKLHWVKVHVGHAGNERADVLAKEAALSNSSEYIEIPGSKKRANSVILENCLDDWRFMWVSSERNKDHLRFIL